MEAATQPVRRISLEEAWQRFDYAARAWLGVGREEALAAIQQGEQSGFDPMILSILEFKAPSIQK